MPRKKTELQPVDSIEQAFLEAIERLITGKPNNPRLQTAAAARKLKFNISNVAVEAGHSRSLIAYKGCKYPRVLDRIRTLLSNQPAPDSASAVLARLREENAALQLRLQQSISHNAALIRRMHVLEQQLQAEKTKLALTRPHRGPNQIVGQQGPSDGKVTPSPDDPKG